MKRLNPYLTGGITPDWIDYLLAFQEAGADAVEIGLPFSDPMLDGATIQQASDQALRRGASVTSILADLTAARDRIRIPLIAMTYANLVFHHSAARPHAGGTVPGREPQADGTTPDRAQAGGTAPSREPEAGGTAPDREQAGGTAPDREPEALRLAEDGGTRAAGATRRSSSGPDGAAHSGETGPDRAAHGSEPDAGDAASGGGPEAFCRRLAAAGFSGLIVPDVPIDELDQLEAAAAASGIDLILLAAPVTPPDRLAEIGARSRNFVYAVSVMATTGERDALAESAAPLADRIKAVTDLPVLIGFGISTPAQAAEAARAGDGVVIGAALMRRVLDGASPADLRVEVAAFRTALDQLDQEVPAAPAHAEISGDRR
ncbi:tryptophan synthase subunit alpha [Actinoplanes awajinensis]|uniref:Tryptophan synthase alpha chain n=1 Tax=Actinoplanes awajinensis subsp. mycoplanecinus TaxID=135947 RepID=A0A117MK50_9ACTN|nr:tryptophan synthase subunit alpha [Actinoplanes awajinensis]KUL21669.1 tryptophan synthase subunit alpha [Actinoplanes awajinensis subsp. mycoplanecinus]